MNELAASEMNPASIMAVIIGAVGLMTLLARVIEKLVASVVEERKQKNDSVPPNPKSGYTTDLALQRKTLEQLVLDIKDVEVLVRSVNTGLTKDIPFSMHKLDSKLEDTRKNVQELMGVMVALRAAIEGNTHATHALYGLLERLLKR